MKTRTLGGREVWLALLGGGEGNGWMGREGR